MSFRSIVAAVLAPPALTALFALSGCGASAAGGRTPANGTIPPASGTMTTGAAERAGNNIFWNETFEEGTLLPWSATFAPPAKGSASLVSEELCLKVDAAGTNTYDVVLRQRRIPIARAHKYQIVMKVHASAKTQLRPRVAMAGPPYDEYWAALVDVGPEPRTFVGTFEGGADDQSAEFAVHLGGPLAGEAPFEVCFDDLQLNDPDFKVPEGRQTGPLPKVRVNQVGYLPGLAKIATYKTIAAQPVEWQLLDAAGQVVASGQTKPFGEDKAAGEQLHNIDFSSFKTPGQGYRLKAGGDESYPFDIGKDVYHQLKYDALAFFYHNRSGIEIRSDLVGEQWARPAGHPGDASVACAPASSLQGSYKQYACDYELDVSGGWYDAGDHGKYVVNGGISLWTMLNEFETLKYLGKSSGDFGDRRLKIPEAGNGVPDLLDEARWEMEWVLKMQVPAGKPHAGMAHTKIHSVKWTPIPTRPDQDKVERYLRPVGTGATLNLVGVAAQAARIWKTIDPAFSAKCLKAAEAGWAAAKKEPSILAEPMGEGGGAYGDSNFDDEWYWAAAELFITTGKPEYKTEFQKLPHHQRIPVNAGGGTASMSWDQLSVLGKISLSVVPNKLSREEVQAQRRQIIGAADQYLALIEKRGYRVPVQSDRVAPWGSNSFVLNNMVIMGLAYGFAKDRKYANGVVDAMDYILGRNPNVQSYVSGYGERPLQHPHHRFWAQQKDPKFPPVPPGVVSGGPNSNLEDPYAKEAGLPGCPPQKCFIDNIESWSTNEIAINWNAPLAWAAAFLDEVDR
ncbi:MAG: glycoside hydrolase family 9 protein [Polyangiaceae bacterium]|nr:glycoside hydrolase family 9 protein [Polyangiaceae bacterium]